MGLQLTVSEPSSISPARERHWFPRLFSLPDGRLLQFNATVDDATEALSQPGGAAGRLMQNGGRDWDEVAMPRYFGFPVALKHGQVRAFSYNTWQRGADVVAAVADLSLESLEWTDQPQAVLHLPPLLPPLVDSVASMEFDRTILCEPDGTLLASMYGKFQRDTKFRSILVSSVDGGNTWEYRSTIAYDPEIGREGFCEPVLARVRDGSLLAIMRTGGHEPLFQCRSLDDGHTWEAPVSLGVPSVDPDLCLMQNGILACSFGRPTVQIMFSLDGSGRQWTTPTLIYSGPQADGSENSTCYTGLREVSPGRLLLVYDTNSSGSPWRAHDNQINAVFIDIHLR